MATTKTADAPTTEGDQNGDGEPTCFVVIGFGTKTDYSTGRVLDLDLTYTKLIKPAFDKVGIRCFRAIDVNVTGSIDMLMYNWIYQADYVIADLSTMNANVFYELGVRHAQKPNTTLIMAENGLFSKLPFDLGHTIIYGYEHLGEEIADEEAERFVGLLSSQLEKLIKEPVDFDSPVYTYMRGMAPPTWEDPDKRIARLEAQLAERLEAQAEQGDEPLDEESAARLSLAALVQSAEKAKKKKDFTTAKTLFRTAIDNIRTAAAGEGEPPDIDDCQPEPAVDLFLWQRLALVTYKEGEGPGGEAAIASLKQAEKILICKCEARISTDPETLGLSGAVNKRLYERTGERQYFEKSVGYYERGFYIKQDYYNGINVAFMYTTEAARLAEAGETFEAIVNYGHGNIIRRKVAEICEALIDDEEAFAQRGDQEWVYLTLWEAYFGAGEGDKARALEPEIELVASDFGKGTWNEQKQKLGDAMALFHSLVGEAVGGTPAAAAPAPDEAEATETVSPVPAVVAPQSTGVATTRSGDTIAIDLSALRNRPLKSVEVKIEFAD